MRLGKVLLGAAVILNVAVPQVASSQMKSPPGGEAPPPDEEVEGRVERADAQC